MKRKGGGGGACQVTRDPPGYGDPAGRTTPATRRRDEEREVCVWGGAGRRTGAEMAGKAWEWLASKADGRGDRGGVGGGRGLGCGRGDEQTGGAKGTGTKIGHAGVLGQIPT
ncbi:hypothetical protein SKAU_G00309430 [Synaphobranchus kaupii]|uniref:Uncharacterized protein n=1 Tax=Synaphobranchus kaupii TaxID=118154 RepID=A0A9Q1IIZ9_SYNKA|nr:hypothetical protein SKAU_G00309430 [Synaphobranchus kaupii]